MLLAVPFAWALSTSLLIPVLPQVRAALGVDPVRVSLLLTALSLPAGLLLPVAGLLADRIGRKPVLIAGLALYGLGGLLAGAAGAWGAGFGSLLAARALQGVGAAATNLIAVSMAADLFGGQERLRAVALLEAANSAGKLLAPVLGAAAAALAWYAPFFVYPGVAWPVALAVAARVAETLGRPAPGEAYARRLGRVARRSGALLAVAYAAGLAGLALWFGLLVVYADLLAAAGIRGGLLQGALVALPVAVMAAASAGAGRLAGRLSARGLAVAGLVVVGAAGAGAALGLDDRLGRLAGPVTAVAAVGAGLGLTLPALDAQVTDAVEDEERGLATTLLGAARAVGGAGGPPLLSALAGAAGEPAVWTLTAALGGALAVAEVCAGAAGRDAAARRPGGRQPA